MGFSNFRKNQKESKKSLKPEAKTDSSEKKKNTEEELMEQLIESAISKALSLNNTEGKFLLLSNESYMPLFKSGALIYLKKWKLITGEILSEPEVYKLIQNGIDTFSSIKAFYSEGGYQPDFYKLLKDNSEGRYGPSDYCNFFPDPDRMAENRR